jgi:hypothetical protein
VTAFQCNRAFALDRLCQSHQPCIIRRGLDGEPSATHEHLDRFVGGERVGDDELRSDRCGVFHEMAEQGSTKSLTLPVVRN